MQREVDARVENIERRMGKDLIRINGRLGYLERNLMHLENSQLQVDNTLQTAVTEFLPRLDDLLNRMERSTRETSGPKLPVTSGVLHSVSSGPTPSANHYPSDNVALFEESKEGNKNEVRKLLEAEAKVNTGDSQGNTPSRWVTNEAHTEDAGFLLEKGPNVDAADENKRTALLDAVNALRALRESFAPLLIERDRNMNARDSQGDTHLHYAAKKGDRDIMALLLEQGADVNAADEHGVTALHVAAERDDSGRSVSFLIERGANVNSSAYDGDKPLHYAAREGHTKVVALLLEKGADVQGVLHSAANSEHESLQVVSMLIEKGSNVNESGYCGTPLHLAVHRGHTQVVALLLDKGADVNAANGMGETALHLAAAREDESVRLVSMLIAAGADLHARDCYKWTPLQAAKGKEVAALLRQAGAHL